jgi:PHP family Zn ribbon phosphoesterase
MNPDKTKNIYYVCCSECKNNHELPDWAKGSEYKFLNYKCEKCGKSVSSQIELIPRILEINPSLLSPKKSEEG